MTGALEPLQALFPSGSLSVTAVFIGIRGGPMGEMDAMENLVLPLVVANEDVDFFAGELVIGVLISELVGESLELAGSNSVALSSSSETAASSTSFLMMTI